jgi:ubiquitin carboxyl-terminal hydrolase 14
VQQKAKILKKISYGLELDVYDNCSEELKKTLDGPRAALKAQLDSKVAKPALPAADAAAGGDAVMTDASSESKDKEGGDGEGGLTGKYELIAVLTHKGRSADSGHYVAWVRQEGGYSVKEALYPKGKAQAKGNTWVLFDDDELSIKTDEDVLGLSGGGDWHMAYLLLYKAIRA